MLGNMVLSLWFLRKTTISPKPSTLSLTGSYLTLTDLTIHQALMTISLAVNVTHILFDGI
jgi:hypothetical protein